MSTLIQTKEFVTYKSPLDSFEVANERFLGILEPGLIRGFDTLYVNSALSFNLLHSSGIAKTNKAGTSTSPYTGVLYTKQGTILHFSDDFGTVTITRDSEQSSADIYWAVGVLHKYVSEEGINPIVLKVSEPSISEAAAISDMNGDDPNNTILIGVLSFKPKGTSKDIDLQTNRTLFTWEPKPSGDIAGHKNISRSEVDPDTIVRTLNDQTVNGEKSFSDLKGISEANSSVKIPITNNIQNRVFSDITTTNYTAFLRINDAEFLTDDNGDFLSTTRIVRVLVNIIDPKPNPINNTFLIEIKAEPQTLPLTYTVYLITTSGINTVNDCIKLYHNPTADGNANYYLAYYHGSITVSRTATISYTISDPHTRGFHPVDNNTFLNAGAGITITALYPSGSEGLLKYSPIGISARTQRISIPTLEESSGTSRWKYITLGYMPSNVGSYVVYHISGAFINSNNVQEQFSMFVEFRWKDYTNIQTTQMLSCNVISSSLVKAGDPIMGLAQNIVFCWDTTSQDIYMTVLDSTIDKPYKYNDLSNYSTIRAFFDISILDADPATIQSYRNGLALLPSSSQTRREYPTWLVSPRVEIGKNKLKHSTTDKYYIEDIQLNSGIGSKYIYWKGSTSKFEYEDNYTNLTSSDYIKSFEIYRNTSASAFAEFNKFLSYIPKEKIHLYVGPRITETTQTNIKIGKTNARDLDGYIECPLWTIDSGYIYIFIEFPNLVGFTPWYFGLYFSVDY